MSANIRVFRRADRALEHFMNVTQADDKLHEDRDCACYPAFDVFSTLNRDPSSGQAWEQLHDLVTHVTGYDDFQAWQQAAQ